MRNLLTKDDSLYTAAERDAETALHTYRPAAAHRYPSALRHARTVGLAKVCGALHREGFSDSVPPAVPPHPVALVQAVMGARAGSRRPELWPRVREEIAASVAVHALALVGEAERRGRLAGPAGGRDCLTWAADHAMRDPGFSPLAIFEQSVIDGHPWHPGARMRTGMSGADLFAYTPEWTERVPVALAAVAPGVDNGLTSLLRREYPALAARTDAHLSACGHPRDSYQLVPVHPWQLHNVVATAHRDALAARRIVVAPGAYLAARPLLSVRTFAAAHDRQAPHLKTALHVQLTSAVRIVSPAAVHNGPRLSALLRGIADREERLGRDFIVLPELAAGRYQPAADEPPGLAADLGAVLRESPERHVGDGEVALPVAALTARSPLRERPVLVDVLQRIGGERGAAARRFLAAYCDRAFPALFSLLTGWGVALEAHGQNTVVVLRDGLPVRFCYRDLGGIRIHRPRLARRGVEPPELAGCLTTEDDDELRAKLFGALISTSLAELVPVLARVAAVPARELWRLVAQRGAAAYRPLLHDPGTRDQARGDLGALLGPTVPMKALLRMRLADDPLAEQWIAVRNPLAEAA